MFKQKKHPKLYTEKISPPIKKTSKIFRKMALKLTNGLCLD